MITLTSEYGRPGGLMAPAGAASINFGEQEIQEYLCFWFNPSAHRKSPLSILSEWSAVPRPDLHARSESSLVQEGRSALRRSVETCAERTGGRGQQIVFLSGGLDSRTILGALLDHFNTSEIVAATFGMPGEWDFDFAVAVAKEAGVCHERMESFSVEWSTRGLVDSILARQVPLPFPVGQRYLSYRLHERIGRNNVFWDGLCGDSVSWQPDSGLPKNRTSWSWDKSFDLFFEHHLLKGWKSLVKPGFDPRACLPAAPLCDEEILGAPDQLEFGVLAQCNTATRLLKDYTIATPFLTKPWLDFMLGIPFSIRKDQRIYLQIQGEAFPRLFALPLTSFSGLGLPRGWMQRWMRKGIVRKSLELPRRALVKASRMGVPGMKTVNSGANSAIRGGFRKPGPIRDVVIQNLEDLRERGVVSWIDIDGILNHQAADPALVESLVMRLLSLELNLKASEQARP